MLGLTKTVTRVYTREVHMDEPKSITKDEFSFILGSDVPRSRPDLHNEREWWKANQRVGAVVFDTFDKDWAFVALAQNPQGVYQLYASAVSLSSLEEARTRLHTAFNEQLEPNWYE